MISPADRVYRQTKAIKRGQRSIAPQFEDLAAWAAVTFDAAILNVHFDRVPPGERPRLSIIAEREADADRLHGDADAHAKVMAQFRKTGAAPADSLEGLFAIFVAFEGVARTEANRQVTEADLASLKSKLVGADLWLIRPSWDQVVFFFESDSALRASEASGLRKLCADAYAKLASRYDEFGYLRDRPLSVVFDSKENFDKAYKGSWFNYDR